MYLINSDDQVRAELCPLQLVALYVYAAPHSLLTLPRKKFSQPISRVCSTNACDIIIFLGWHDPKVGALISKSGFTCCCSHCLIPCIIASITSSGVDIALSFFLKDAVVFPAWLMWYRQYK